MNIPPVCEVVWWTVCDLVPLCVGVLCDYVVPSSPVHTDQLGLSYRMGKTESKLIKTVLESHGFTKVNLDP